MIGLIKLGEPQMGTRAAFQKFHQEAEIIGRLLCTYTQLELDLMHCAQVVRDDFDTTLKIMFRTRGESQRIAVADAFGRHHYHGLKLGTQFEMAIGSMQHCLRIRNQYAHCIWWADNSGHLTFANLEEIARDNSPVNDFHSLTSLHLDVPCLQTQEEFFSYTDDLLLWVNFEGRVRAKKLSSHNRANPPQLKQPTLHIP